MKSKNPDGTLSMKFESPPTFSRHKGGSVKITHRSSTLFRYLEAAEVYVPVTAPISGEVDIVLDTAEETKSSYRLTFTCSAGEKKLGYCAVLVKRDDGTFYFDAVLKK